MMTTTMYRALFLLVCLTMSPPVLAVQTPGDEPPRPLEVIPSEPPALVPATAVAPTPTLEQLAPATAINAEPVAVASVRTVPVPAEDLWQRLRRGFQLGHLDSPYTPNHEQWYASRPDYIQRFVDRGARYLYHIAEEVERRNMPTEIVLLPIIESAFNPQSLSSAKAVGMWQFIPSTGQRYGLKQDWQTDNRRDVLLSTNAALDYLQNLYGMFGSWELALAAYNCGEGCVGRAIAANTRKGLPTDYLSLTLPNETRNYVPKLMAVKNIVLSPGNFGIVLSTVENRPYFAKVSAPAKIDVKLAARLAEMDEDEFAALNPAFRRPVAASGTGVFLVPTEKAPVFEENLKLYRSLNAPMVSWQTVQAKRGEAVDAVARRYGMTASYLRATNGPLPERKGKLTQAVSFMAPNAGQARAIDAAFDKKIALRNAGGLTFADMASTPPATVAEYSRLPQDRDIILDGKLIRAGTGETVDLRSLAATEPANYAVQSGDTLYGIAQKFGVSVDNLLRWNQLSPRAVIQPGKKLRIAA